MSGTTSFHINGSYYEACNCDAICPCRKVDGAPGGASTYGTCDFLLNWNIIAGRHGDTDLAGRAVCMAGRYLDDEEGCPWTVVIYIDRAASDAQFNALSEIFRGQAGGNLHFTGNITTVLDVKRAGITLSHEDGQEYVTVDGLAAARVDRLVDFDGSVSCGIPGHAHPGKESYSSLHVDEPGLAFSYRERCGFATSFAYQN